MAYFKMNLDVIKFNAYFWVKISIKYERVPMKYQKNNRFKIVSLCYYFAGFWLESKD